MSSGTPGHRIFILEHDQDIAAMEVSVLENEGYEVASLLSAEEVEAAATRRRPDLIIADLNPLNEDPYRSLDLLRTSPSCQGVPVLATCTTRNTVEGALTSYNVRGILEKPFGLDEFLEAVVGLLGRPVSGAASPEEPLAGSPSQLAAQVLAQHSRDAIFRWVQRLRSQPPWRDRTDLRLPEVLDDIPVLVEALALTLRTDNGDDAFDAPGGVADRARDHLRARRKQGISTTDQIREYALLRDELLNLLERHLTPEVSPQQAFEIAGLLNRTLDRIIAVIVPANEEQSRE